MSQDNEAELRRQAFDDDAEAEAWRMRRQIDRELITAIRRQGDTEKEVSRLKIAMFGFRGDNGVMGTVKALDDKLDGLHKDLVERDQQSRKDLSERDKAIHAKIDSGLGGIYKALIGASLSFVVASVILVLGVIIPNS
jgi:phage host-nuclease inhibitor protein Gam